MATISELTLRQDTVLSSHHELQIAGIRTHIYGINECFNFLDEHPPMPMPWAVLHLVHPRTRDYTYTEKLAHLVLSQYYAQDNAPEYPMIAVTFDLPNHGSRKLSNVCNEDWKGGNPTHAQDMISNIQGAVQDVELVMKFLPAYLDASFLSKSSKFKAPPSRIIDIVSGVSLGAYVAWQIAANQKVKAAIPIIGSPYLTFVLLHRRLMQANGLSTQEADKVLLQLDKPLYEMSANEINTKVFRQDTSLYWPVQIHDIVAEIDRKVFALHPGETSMLIINSKDDPLVPARFTTPWIQKWENHDPLLFEQTGVGHVCTHTMVDELSKYVINIVRKL